VTKRHKEHTRKYLSGEYTVLKTDVIFEGKREEVWHGWGWTPEKRAEFTRRESEIRAAAEKQLAECRIFLAKIGTAPRLLERIEASIMAALYDQPPPVSTIPDRGMQLAPRWPDEEPIILHNLKAECILGLPKELEI